MPQLFLILEEGNTSLLTRALGDIQPPRFASQGLLSTIASWCMETSGHELRVIASTNVRVVYRRFDNNLLFVLVTSNLLLQTELLQLHLETLYDVLLLLVGSAALVLDTSAKISLLKTKLRGPGIQRAVDSFIADDTLVPCISLPVPQLVGLPLREKETLRGALGKVVATLGCQHAALISEGYYLAATHGWWTLLTPREQMLVQHIATQHAANHTDDCPPELLVHVAKRHYEAPFRLRLLRLQDAVILAVLYESGNSAPPPLKDFEDKLHANLLKASNTLETPLWLSSPVPQFSTITFDLALVVVHSPPSAVLLWGHSGTVLQQGFNPLVSPTLRKQMGSSTSPIVSRLSYRSPVNREDSLAAGGDGLQLFFRSTLDTLVSFVLQTWPQMPPALQALLQDRRSRAGGAGGAGTPQQGQGQARAASVSPPRGQEQPQTAAKTTATTPGPGGTPQRATRGTSPASRLGLGAFRRTASSALASSMGSATRLQALFGRSSSSNTNAAAVAAAASAEGAGPGLAAGAAAIDGRGLVEEVPELAHVPYEEVHAVIEGTRLLALLDRTGVGAGGTAGPGAVPAAGAPSTGAEDVLDLFMAFPKRVSRMAALEAAVTLRATYLMAYHSAAEQG